MFKKAKCLIYCDSMYSDSSSHGSLIYDKLDKSNILDEIFDKEKDQEKRFKLLVKTLPHGSIFSKDLKNSKVYVSLPFFSSHLRVPVKAGENVWIYEDASEYNKNSLVNSYWISRIHGLMMSEDVSYTYNERDIATSIEKIINNDKNIVDFIVNQSTNSGFKFSDGNDIENYRIDNQNTSLPIVPRYFGSNNDLILQGSTNSLIALTGTKNLSGSYLKQDKNSGKILLSAGRGHFSKEKKESIVNCKDIDEVSRKIFNTKKINTNTKKNSTTNIEIQNESNIKENFKLPSLYQSKDSKKVFIRNKNEGAPSIKHDASTIIVSEGIDDNYFSEYELKKQKNIDYLTVALETNNHEQILNIKKPISKKKQNTFKINEFKSSGRNISSPLICMHSSNIKLIARADSELNPLSKDGSIMLIKSSSSNSKYGEISIRENGNIVLNGRKIIIGDYKRQDKKEHGHGDTVILGSGNELRSGVLGENLVALLIELIEINKKSLQLISESISESSNNFSNCNDNFNSLNTWANKHVHTSPAGGLTGLTTSPSQNPVSLDITKIDNVAKKIINSKEPKLTDKLSDLILNIDKILSKFVKTS